jgi:exonuclease SbcC
MLKELFNLDRFDIAAGAFQKLGETKNQYSYLDGQISQFEEINKTVLRQLTKEINGLESEVKKLSKAEEKLSGETKQLQVLEHLHQELSEITEVVNTLEADGEFYQQKHRHLNRYLRIRQVFRDRIIQQLELLEQTKSGKHDLQQAIEATDRLTENANQARTKWEQAQADYRSKEQLHQQVEELNLMVRLKNLHKELDSGITTHDQTAQDLRDLDRKIQLLESVIEQGRTLTSGRAGAVEALQKLTVLQNWWNIFLEKEKHLEILQRELSDIKKEIASLNREKSKLLSGQKDLKNLTVQINQARQQLQALLVQEDWQAHARHLEDGRPCPLCGSVEHPDPIPSSGLGSQIETAR